MMKRKLKIHHILEHSWVNGPGCRAVLWTQGCPLNCPGCFNIPTHTLSDGVSYDPLELATYFNTIRNIRGITISGGEPLIQTGPLITMIKYLKPELDILLFSGFTLEEITKDTTKKRILHYIDAGLFGRYNKNLQHSFRGKKLVLHGKRIERNEIKPYCAGELFIDNNTIVATGLF